MLFCAVVPFLAVRDTACWCCWCFGSGVACGCAVQCSLYSGATCEMLPTFEPAQVWECLGRQRDAKDALSLFMAVPTIYAKLHQWYQDQVCPLGCCVF